MVNSNDQRDHDDGNPESSSASSCQSSPGPWQQAKPVIGLLGGVGAGKSAVAKHFAALGCGVIDADQLAKQALDTPEVQKQLRQWWGDGVVVVDEHGQPRVDRQAVSEIVFKPGPAGQDQLVRLENEIHPRVANLRQALMEQFLADDAIVAIVEDCPLLLEKKLAGDCDVLVFIEVSEKIRQERVIRHRGWSVEALNRRQSRQGSLDMKRKVANYVVSNDGSPTQTQVEVRDVLASILKALPSKLN